MSVNAILVKPSGRTICITPDVKDYADFRTIARAIASRSGYIGAIFLGNGDVIYVDDEGRINGTAERQGRFWVRGPVGVCIVIGNGLFLSVDDDGHSAAPILTIEEVVRMVEWEEPADCADDGKAHSPTFINL